MLDNTQAVTPTISVVTILEPQSSSRGGSLPFKAMASDDHVYWVKMAQNAQGPRMLATEQIVSACGRLIRAPVCDTELIDIPAELDGHVLANGTTLRRGIAHASRNIDNSQFDKFHTPQNRDQDDNRRRHAGYFALYDWCWGDDMQWLYDLSDNRRTYSHDHGHFLPDGPDWTIRSLEEHVDSPREIDPRAQNLDQNELGRIAATLRALQRDNIRPIIANIPTEWGLRQDELEAVGWFLDRRRDGVADRLQILSQQST